MMAPQPRRLRALPSAALVLLAACCGAGLVAAQQPVDPAQLCAADDTCTVCEACCVADMSVVDCAACSEASCTSQPPPPQPPPVRVPCVADADGACSGVCAECCQSWFHEQGACDSCAARECDREYAAPAPAPAPAVAALFDCAAAPAATACPASPECLEQCWAPWAPCLSSAAETCSSSPHVLLLIAVLLPYCGRVLGDRLLGLVFPGASKQQQDYDLLDEAPEQHPMSVRATVSRNAEKEAPVRALVPYEYTVEVQGEKDCIISVEFEPGNCNAIPTKT